MLDLDLALVDTAGLPYAFLTELERMGVKLVHAHPGEEWGLNLLALAPRRVLMAEGSPRTAERLTDAGVEALTARGGAAEVVIERDAFANIWYVLAGDTEETVLVGSHSDCVPDGGWLDGILGVHAGLGVLAAIAGQPRRRRTLAVVDCLVTRLLG